MKRGPELIATKLHALVDRDRDSKHATDLLALDPTDAELEEAARWTREQDKGTEFPALVDEAVTWLRARRR